jgi:hypothetical protein
MTTSFNYTAADGTRWVLSVDKWTVTVFCDGESREYNLVEVPVKTEHKEEYVYLTHADGSIRQFKFEHDKFLVGDVFDAEGAFVDTFACHVFGID